MDFPRMCPVRWLSDQDFSTCIPPHDFLYPFYDMHSNYYRSWKGQYNQGISKEFGSTIENEKGNYKITLDVHHFRSNEIIVKVRDNEIIVEGHHEERPDTHGFITRQFKRRYPLPSHCPAENVTSTLSSDGVLTIIAEKIITTQREKIVPIKMCGTSRKTQMETKITTESSKKTEKENLRETEDINKNKSQSMVKEDHSRLLKPEFLKETKSESNGTCSLKAETKESIDITKTAEKISDIGSVSNKIEETIGKTILGLTALTEQLGTSSAASSSDTCKKNFTDMSSMIDATDTCGMKAVSETCGVKVASEVYGMKGAPEICGIKVASETRGIRGASETCGIKGASETCSMKAGSETCGVKVASETCGIQGASETCGMKAASEIVGVKVASEACGMKGAPETCGIKGPSETSGMKSTTCEIKNVTTSDMQAMSKTLIEESSSSFKASSSSTSSTTKLSGKTMGKCVSDISAELREAAENV